LGVLLSRFRLRGLYIFVANIVAFGLLLVAIEFIVQIYAHFHPSYYVLFLEPDREVGWKQSPGLRWTWAGQYWFAREFSVPVQTNSQGFRDVERNVFKPQGVLRVALLGDSFLEAVQVPFDKTAGHLLEQRLNAGGEEGREQRKEYEVLNFAISNYGVGQYLLVWEQYAAKFRPDYVFIFTGEYLMQRTINKYGVGVFPGTEEKRIWIRPTFRLENGKLVREEARDFDQFVKIQKELINTFFLGQRILERPKRFSFPDYLPWLYSSLMRIQRRFPANRNDGKRLDVLTAPEIDDETVAINLRLIEELGRQVSQAGGYLVIVNWPLFFQPNEPLAKLLARFCIQKQLGYVDLSEYLSRAKKNGIATSWVYDAHFNEAGNSIFAEAMYDWMATKSQGRIRPRHDGSPPQ
jgi:hypothetical protein